MIMHYSYTRIPVFLILLLAAPLFAQKQTESSIKTLDPSQGSREAQNLLSEVFAERPEQTFSNALLRIRDRDGAERKVRVRFATRLTPTNWSATYSTDPSEARGGI